MKQGEGFHTPEQLRGFIYENDLGNPGEYPFTRGIYSTMYRGRLWTMRQYSGFGDSRQTNRRFRYLLDQGQTGLSIAFDLPTQLGYDSDHPLSAGEVGRVGVPVSTMKDMERIFHGIPLEKVSTSMTINATAPVIFAMYIALARRRGIDLKSLRGTVQNDILKEYLARGNYIFPVMPSIRLSIDLWEFCIKHLPMWNMVSISGYHIREAGANALQELAFTFTNGICYIKAALQRGIDIDEFAPRISFFFGVHNNFLEEIAKFRAARRIWARLMRERFGAKNKKSWMLRFHAQTCGSTLTAQQPENNIVRVTLQALAAVMGGTQSLHTNSYDEALALPSQKSQTIALRIQQILAHESGVANTIDPFGGSYSVEYMTSEIESGVMKLMEEIESRGGAIGCLESGYSKRTIEDSAYKQQRDIEESRQMVIGVNSFISSEKQLIETLRVCEDIEEERKEELTKYRSSRDSTALRRALSDLENKASGDENLIYPILEVVDKGGTLGEICKTLRGVFGTYD